MDDRTPNREDCVRAVARAASARRTRHRANPDYAHLTAAALAERVVGLLAHPRIGTAGWWLVGRVIDELADAEFDVWLIPGERRTWIDRETRSPAIYPLTRHTAKQ